MSGFVFVEEAPIAGLERPAHPGTTIGRADCEIELNDPDVSRRHAAVRQVDAGLALEDLGSTNGTWVNGLRIEGIVELSAGDEVRLGNTIWRLELRTSDAGDTPTQRAASG
jgi:pSer/pThr/pTyr-binding forkhead associated (FHA) protein